MKFLLFFLLPIIVLANPQVELGVPTSNMSLYLISRTDYSVGYFSDYGVPMWVSWNLNKNYFGDVARYSGNFIQDTSLPDGIVRIVHSDYTNSGYDRGHLVRSEERTNTVIDNKSTFILTNIIPQTPELNRDVWLELEYYCENLCKDFNKELYIIAGPAFANSNPIKLKNKVAVPDSCYKIIFVLDSSQTISDVNANTKIIAVMMPNNATVKQYTWEHYQTSIDNIEVTTGIDFLNALPNELEEKLEKIIPSSVEDIIPMDRLIYPNPAKDFIRISNQIESFHIYDSNGKLLLSGNNNNVDLINFSSGRYFLKSMNTIIPFTIEK